MALEKQYHEELKKELEGVPIPSKEDSIMDTGAEEESIPGNDKKSEDNANMSKVVMSRNKRKLYEAMEVNCLYFRCHFIHRFIFLLLVS